MDSHVHRTSPKNLLPCAVHQVPSYQGRILSSDITNLVGLPLKWGARPLLRVLVGDLSRLSHTHKPSNHTAGSGSSAAGPQWRGPQPAVPDPGRAGEVRPHPDVHHQHAHQRSRRPQGNPPLLPSSYVTPWLATSTKTEEEFGGGGGGRTNHPAHAQFLAYCGSLPKRSSSTTLDCSGNLEGGVYRREQLRRILGRGMAL